MIPKASASYVTYFKSNKRRETIAEPAGANLKQIKCAWSTNGVYLKPNEWREMISKVGAS